MRKACWIWLVAVSLGSAGVLRADDKPAQGLPPGAIAVDDLKKHAAKQQTTRQAPKQMGQSRLGIGDFFRKLFGPSEPKINGTIIGGARTYKNGISPLPPIVPR